MDLDDDWDALPKTRVATGLNTSMDHSKFHHSQDQGWSGNLGLTDCEPRRSAAPRGAAPRGAPAARAGARAARTSRAHAARTQAPILARLVCLTACGRARLADNIANREYSTHVVSRPRKYQPG